MEELSIRDERWLRERVKLLQEAYFSDVSKGLPIVTKFGLRAKYRFGSIEAKKGVSFIKVNRLFAELQVPEYVVDATIAHELVHYAHGFGSGLPKLHENPHRGGVVDAELENRGLGELNEKAENWRKAHWESFYESQCGDITDRKAEMSAHTDQRWRLFIESPGNRNEAYLNSRLLKLMNQMNIHYTEGNSLTVEWLYASSRQTGLSYWYPKESRIRLNGLLADKRVPEYVIDFELSYWLTRLIVGSGWKKVQARLIMAGMETVVEKSINWRRKSWSSFIRRNHPLLLHIPGFG